MSPEEETEIRGIIATIPPINSYNGPITRLGGLTNRVYQLSSAVLRVPGKGTAEVTFALIIERDLPRPHGNSQK